MSLLRAGDVMGFEPPEGPDEAAFEDVRAQRHPSCWVCGEACCFCPLACPGGEAVEVEDESYAHTNNCLAAYRAELAVGEAIGRAILRGGNQNKEPS